MNVLSTFNGLGSIWVILDRLGIDVNKRYSSEIDKYANIVNDTNYPNTIQLGDITKLKGCDLEPIDLLVGGSPCQGFSFAGKQLNFEDPRSKLFFEFVRLYKETKPKYFLLENVKMKQEYQDIISGYLGVKPLKVNSNRFSSQSRERLYWTNLKINELPNVNNDSINDILEHDKTHEYITGNYTLLDKHNSKMGLICVAGLSKTKKWLDNETELQRNYSQGERIYSTHGKSPTLSAMSGGTAGRSNLLIFENEKIRKLTTTEIERLQGLPPNYTSTVSKSQAHKLIGNGWQIDTVEFILKNLK